MVACPWQISRLGLFAATTAFIRVKRHVSPDSQSPMNHAWRRWQRFAHRAAEIQSRVLLILLYFALVTPIALVIGFVKSRGASRTAMWHPVASPPESLDSARKQF
jgi:hypothetical protein